MSTKLLELETGDIQALCVTGSAAVERDILAGPCRVHDLVINAASNAMFLKLFDNADPTVGTTIPDHLVGVSASVAVSRNYGTTPLEFRNGLSLAVTTTSADDNAAQASAATITLTLSPL